MFEAGVQQQEADTARIILARGVLFKAPSQTLMYAIEKGLQQAFESGTKQVEPETEALSHTL